MALITCPECGKEISNTCSKCIHCGYVLKKKKTINIKVLIAFIIVIVLLAVAGIFIFKLLNQQKYPELMKLIQEEYVSDAVDLLGDDYEIMLSQTARFYVYENIELDGIVYDEIHITELKSSGDLYEIGINFSTDDLDKIDVYVKDVCKIYGDYEEKSYSSSSNTYDWTTPNKFNPQLTIRNNKDSYDIDIKVK